MPRPIRIISNDNGMPITVLAETKGKRYTKDNHPYYMYIWLIQHFRINII